ncbi:CASP-like protein 1E2 [Fagus crenata]
MESQNKASIGGIESTEKEMKVANQRIAKSRDLFVRLLAFVLTLVAAVIFVLDKQTKVVPIQLTESLPPINVSVSAKWHYLSAFVGESKMLHKMIIILDTLMVALLFSGNGAASAVALVGLKGNYHVQWKEVCSVFGKFCDQAAAAIVVSQLGSLAFLLLVIMSNLSLLHKKI